MRAIIPVAGFGKRLKPHTYSIPKVLLNVGGKPILGHILDRILEENITKATFVLGYLGEMIKDYIKSVYKEIDAAFVNQDELLGLGHAIYKATPTFDDEIFIILGDTIFDVDLKDVFKQGVSSLGVKRVEDPRRFGVAILNNDFITELVEKPQNPISNLALVGLYYIKNPSSLKSALEELIEKNITTAGEYQLTDALQLMIKNGEKFNTFSVDGWFDCGKPETLLSTNKFLLSKNNTKKKLAKVVVNHPVFIAESAEIENSVIGPFATISDNCRITDSIIKNSIISSGAVVTSSIFENSIIGSNAIIKGTTKKLNAGDSSQIEFY
jgi:glucose-1-phosphate thymidylyltransferase